MKIIVQLKPDEVEYVLNEVEENDFIIDQDTYCHFRDGVFIKDMEMYIKKISPGKWQETVNLDDDQKVEQWYKNQSLINKYYRNFTKKRQKYYLYKDNIYCYEFLGFMNVTNEIQLMMLEKSDIIELLNKPAEPPLTYILKRLGFA